MRRAIAKGLSILEIGVQRCEAAQRPAAVLNLSPFFRCTSPALECAELELRGR